MVTARGSTCDECALWGLGNADLHRRPEHQRNDSALGDKGGDGRPRFRRLRRESAAPEPAPGTVVILYNLATHKNAEATKAMRNAGCRFLFLPPYSPNLNPVEMASSKLKAHLRRIGARSFTEMLDAIAEACDPYDP